MEKYEALFPRIEKSATDEAPPDFEAEGLDFEKEGKENEKLREQLEEALSILGSFEQIKDILPGLDLDSLCDTSQDLLHREGCLVISPEKVHQKAKIILASNIKSALSRINDEQYSAVADVLLKQGRLALIALGDLEDAKKYFYDGLPKRMYELSLYLRLNSESATGRLRLNASEVRILFESDFKNALVNVSHHGETFFEEAPEFFIRALLDNGNASRASELLALVSSPNIYSHDLLESFIRLSSMHYDLLTKHVYKFRDSEKYIQKIFKEYPECPLLYEILDLYDGQPEKQKKIFFDCLPHIFNIGTDLAKQIERKYSFLAQEEIEGIQKDITEADKIHVQVGPPGSKIESAETVKRVEDFIASGKASFVTDELSYAYQANPEFVISNLIKYKQISLKHYLGEILPEHKQSFNTLVAEEYFEKGYQKMIDHYLEPNITSGFFSPHSAVFALTKEIDHLLPNDALFWLYVRKYLKDFDNNQETVKGRQDFVEVFAEGLNLVIKNKAPHVPDQNVYQIILKEVYPQRNYDTYKYLNQYQDRSADLAAYNFDREGYEMRLSGVVGYRIKEGLERDSAVLENYQSRIQKVQELAQSEEGLGSFIKENFPESKAETLEGKVLEYVQQHRNDAQSLDLLLAYQLQGHYDQFVGGSRDRTETHEQIEGKEYVMLSELSERYGDLMKETLKELSGKISGTEDEKLFGKDSAKDIEKGEKLGEKILQDLSWIPRERLSTETIQKKVATSIAKAFQGFPVVKEAARAFAQEFTVDNFNAFSGVFSGRIRDFISEGSSQVDIRSVEELRQKTYADIKQELDKYEEIKEVDDERKGEVKMSKERLIKGYFSKNRENAHARMVGDICLAADPTMLENRNYFEFVMFDEERKKCVGTVMLLRMEEPDGKKFLLYCPNPSVDLVSQVSAEKLYKLITSQVISFAQENNFDGVVFNKQHGQATNRSGLFQAALEKSVLRREGNELLVNLQNEHVLSGGYKYQASLNAVWLKESVNT